MRQSSEGVTNWLMRAPNLSLIAGHAHFEGSRAVRVKGELLEAQRIFINVGARAGIRDLPGLAGVPYFTNSTF